MKLNQLRYQPLKGWLRVAVLGLITTIVATPPTHALIPYVYEPSPLELKGASLGIGRTAAQLLQLGQPKEAALLAALAVRLQPEDERLWSIFAEAQLRSDQLDAASHSLARAKQLNPKKAGLWFAEASLALRDNRPADAVSLLIQGLELDPDNAGAYFDLGNARVMQANLQIALKAFEKASGLQPTFWEAVNNQGIVLFEMGKIKAAINRWRRVLQIKRNAEPMLALAAALNQINPGSTEALALANQALAKNPNYVLPRHQKEQLWGERLRQATSHLLTNPNLRSAVERAEANADTNQ